MNHQAKMGLTWASPQQQARNAAQPEPGYRDVVIKGDLWRIEFLPDHAASVVLVRANYEVELKEKNSG